VYYFQGLTFFDEPHAKVLCYDMVDNNNSHEDKLNNMKKANPR